MNQPSKNRLLSAPRPLFVETNRVPHPKTHLIVTPPGQSQTPYFARQSFHLKSGLFYYFRSRFTLHPKASAPNEGLSQKSRIFFKDIVQRFRSIPNP